MTTTVTGFDGSIDEASFARGQAVGTRRGVVASRSSFAAFLPADTRSVRLTGGTAWDAGVLVEVDDAVAATVAVTPPQAGQWFLIVMRRSWDSNGVTYELLPHTVTSTATPTAPPVGIPSDFQDKPGRVADQPLWWVHAITGTTALTIVDARRLSPSIEKSGTAAQRAAYYGAEPTWAAGRRALQGATWFNTDTNLHEVYMAPYNASTNPGGVPAPSTPGWYGVGSNGQPTVLQSRYPDTLLLPSGKTAVWDRLDFTLAQGRFLHFRHGMRWRAPGNSAGTMYATLNGVTIVDRRAELRLHSEGGMQGSTWNYIEYDLWVPAGTHRIDGVFFNEAAGNDSYKQDTVTVVTGASIS